MQGGSIDVPVAQAGAARCDAVTLSGTPQTDAAPPLGGVAVVAAVPPASVTGAVHGGSIDVVAAQAGAARGAVPLPDAPQTETAPPGGAGMATNGAHPPASVAGAVITAKIGDAPQHDSGDLPDDAPLGQLVASLRSRSAVAVAPLAPDAEFERAFQWQKGDVLQVSDDNAPFKWWGFWGRVDLVHGDHVYLQAAGSSAKVQRMERRWLRRLSPPPEAPGPHVKNVNWIDSAMLAHMASAEWLPVPLPEETATLDTQLAESEIAGGCLEIGWRLRTKGVVVVPPVRGTFAAQHCLNNDALNDHGEGAVLVDQLLAYAARAKLLLVPLLSDGHWVLLAVQRSGSTGKVCGKCEPTVCDDAAGVIGCNKCEYSEKGCAHCNASKHYSRVERNYDEWGFVDPLTRVEPLPQRDNWEIRYWDSLDAQHISSSNLSRACLDGLQPAGVRVGPVGRGPAPLLPRCNKLTQGNTQRCGWFTLYAVEEEIRRFRGESAFSIAPNWQHRVTRLSMFVEKLRGCAPPVPP